MSLGAPPGMLFCVRWMSVMLSNPPSGREQKPRKARLRSAEFEQVSDEFFRRRVEGRVVGVDRENTITRLGRNHRPLHVDRDRLVPETLDIGPLDRAEVPRRRLGLPLERLHRLRHQPFNRVRHVLGATLTIEGRLDHLLRDRRGETVLGYDSPRCHFLWPLVGGEVDSILSVLRHHGRQIDQPGLAFGHALGDLGDGNAGEAVTHEDCRLRL
uniref:Uncharacterized protein n=1 Tax=uncultured alpha proteobacterium HF0130_06E21 TaxID=710808 RepID=E0XT33_9PROT|nr:hypothetical protein [uncultured alpha proteobacterium HF0130_06E21]